MDVQARPLGKPVADLRRHVDRVFVHDDVEILGHLGLDIVKEYAELTASMAAEALADDLTSGDAQDCEQRGLTVELVVMGDLRTAAASMPPEGSVHKSQGSKYPAAVIPVMTQQYAILKRNPLYSGVTRGNRLLVLVGQKNAIFLAVRDASEHWCRSKPDEMPVGSKDGSERGIVNNALCSQTAVDRRHPIRISARR